jgi:hypothetical protein
MDKKTLREILSAHADHLNSGDATGEDYLRLWSERDEELAPLLDVAEQVQSTLTPITPAPDFEAELKRRLMTTAHIRQVEGYTPPTPLRDLFTFVATLAFVTALATVIVIVRRNTLRLSHTG